MKHKEGCRYDIKLYNPILHDLYFQMTLSDRENKLPYFPGFPVYMRAFASLLKPGSVGCLLRQVK